MMFAVIANLLQMFWGGDAEYNRTRTCYEIPFAKHFTVQVPKVP